MPRVAIGQHFLGDKSYETWPVDTLMAAALLSHLTFFSDLRSLPPAVLDAAAPWLAFYRRYHTTLTDGVVYPLLDDPLASGWTALQSWNPSTASGALLVFRQDAAAGLGEGRAAQRSGRPSLRTATGPTGAVVGQRHVAPTAVAASPSRSLPNAAAQVLLITPT